MKKEGIRLVIVLVVIVGLFSVFTLPAMFNKQISFSPGKLLRTISLDEGNDVKTPTCTPTTEVCDNKDNDCDGSVDEGGVCATYQGEEVIYSATDSDGVEYIATEEHPLQPDFDGYIIQLNDVSVASYKINQKDNLLTKSQSVDSYRESIVAKQENVEAEIKSIASSARIESKVQNVFNGFAVFDISTQEASRIKSLPNVKNVYPNYRVEMTLDESIPLINADDVWQTSDAQGLLVTGKGVTIGIIDTGVDYTHPDLGGCFGPGCKVIGGYDFSDNDTDPMDYHGHGTHVAATAAGNGILKGVAPDANIYSLKVFPNSYASVIIEAIDYSTDPNGDGDFSDHLDVISLSLGGSGNPDDAMSTAIDDATKLGVVAVISAGNSGPWEESIRSPGTARTAITVGATYKKDYGGEHWRDTNPQKDQIVSFSSRGPTSIGTIKPDISAPGVYICAAQFEDAWEDKACLGDGEHTAISGTSMAAPHVSGVVALIKQAHPDWSPEEIKSSLLLMSKKINGTIFDVGWGRIDVLSSLNPTLLINPTGIEVKDSSDNLKNILIKNPQNESLGIEISSITQVVNQETKNSSPISMEVSNTNFCLASEEKLDVALTFQGILDLPVGLYHGDFEIKTFEGCNFNLEASTFNIPVSITKLNKLNIIINTTQYFSPDEKKEFNLFLRTEFCTFDGNLFSSSETGFSYYTKEDSFDVILLSKTFGDQMNGEWRTNYMVKGIDFGDSDLMEIEFNEADSQLISTDIENILQTNGMHPFKITTVYSSGNFVEWDDGIFGFAGTFCRMNEEIPPKVEKKGISPLGFHGDQNLKQSYPKNAGVFNIGKFLENPHYSDYQIFLGIDAKENEKTFHESSKIYSLGIKLEYPFNDKSIIDSLDTVNVTYNQPFIEDAKMSYLMSVRTPFITGTEYNWGFINLPKKVEWTYSNDIVNRLLATYGVIRIDFNTSEYINNFISENKYISPHSSSSNLEFFRGPYELKIGAILDDGFYGIFSYLTNIYGDHFTLNENKSGKSIVTLTNPNGSFVEYYGSPWVGQDLLGECISTPGGGGGGGGGRNSINSIESQNCSDKGLYEFDWKVNNLFIDQDLHLNMELYYDGDSFSTSFPIICGDLNLDGNKFELADLTTLISLVTNENMTLPPQWRNGDMNGDGELTMTDVDIMTDYKFITLGPEPTCQPNMYCETTPKGQCVNYNYCNGISFVNTACDICGCASGSTCPTAKGTPKVCQVSRQSDKGGVF